MTRNAHGLLLVAATLIATACSPGTLPGSPTPILSGGGGARYNGSIVYRRLAGGFAIDEGSQTFNLSLVVRDANQITGRFESGNGIGTISGLLTGDLASGTFDATMLVQTTATQVAGQNVCEGRGEVTGRMTGRELTFAAGPITYENCPGLTVSSQAQAVAVSPIPGEFGGRANVVITVLGGTTVSRGTCGNGIPGFPFTVEMSETSGIDVTWDAQFLVEERRNFGVATSTSLDMPFTALDGGSRRTYGACSPVPGTYQAFFSGGDANGNRIRIASPVVTFSP
jgi:hypothetical protein